MNRTIVKKTTLEDQDEAFCLTLSLDERLHVLESLNRQGCILSGYAVSAPMNRTIVQFEKLVF